MTSRGIRNNNPGNIRRSSDPWQGLATSQTDAAFFQFKSAVWGIRALARVLISYQDQHGLNTINDIIFRWAPPTENNTNAYVKAVAKETGFEPGAKLNLHTFEHLAPLVQAIIYHENGDQPYSNSEITKGLVLAGVEPDQLALTHSRTVGAASTAAALTLASQVIDVTNKAQPTIEKVSGFAQVAPLAFMLVIIALLGYVIYARIDDRRKGLR